MWIKIKKQTKVVEKNKKMLYNNLIFSKKQGGRINMAEVVLKKVEKQYPNGFKAVHGIDLNIKDG